MVSDAVEQALLRMSELLKRAKIRHAFMGGVAASAWGEPRATYDVDVAVAVSPENHDQLVRILERNKYKLDTTPTLKRVGAALQYVRAEDTTLETRVVVDVFLTSDEYQNEALLRRRRISFRSKSLFLMSAEDTLLYKLLAAREKDMVDVQGILVASGDQLDMKYLRRWARRLGVSGQLEDEISFWRLARRTARPR